MKRKEYTIEVGGKKIVAEFNDLAENANGSVLLRSGETAVLVTAVMADEDDTEVDYLPLTVDYEERFYAVGAILGSSFVRREGKPAEEAILAGRLIDRPIRPLFTQQVRREIQIVATVLALGDTNPAVLGVLGASLALGVSDIPWNGPVSAVRVADGVLNLVVCGKDGNINMIEVGGKEVEEKVLVAALQRAQEEIAELQAWQKKIIKEVGKEKQALTFAEPTPGQKAEQEEDEKLHREVLEKGVRPDGRGMDEVRSLFAQAGGISEALHGTGVFYRGGTHVLSVLTLGGPHDAQTRDSIETHGKKKHFIHHYNFPPFSNGETGKLGGKNRRMIGHGALAEKALLPVIPPQESFPYTTRLVSEALSSNGSTSMGSVCASSLALMDGGVPISAPVAGIAMGLILGKKNAYQILTDIQGPEDHHGDMDLKVAGTRKGITAVQMDVKVSGVPLSILAEAFEKARAARAHILDTMEKVIAAPRADLSPRAPKIISFPIKKEQIGLIIGSGGKTINEIKEKTRVDAIDIEDDGRVCITGKNGTAEKAAAVIKHLIQESENRWGRR